MPRFSLILIFCVFLVVGAAPATAQINYDEATDGDISGGLPADSFNLSAGTNTWTGSIGPTGGGDVQDTFDAVIPANHEITAVRCTGLPADDGGASFAGFFEFDGTSSTTGSLIINNPGLTAGTYNARAVTDFTAVTRTWTIEIDVVDNGVPNSPPTDVAVSPSSVDENEPSGTTVGTLSSTDADGDDTHTYSLVAGSGDADNASFSIVGDQLKTAAVFDFETKNSYSIHVETDDGNGATFSKMLSVTVDGVNEMPTADAGPDQTTLENVMITLDGSGSTDPENNITTYDWDFGDTNMDTGASVMHAYTLAGMYTATLTVTDAGALSDMDDAVITVVSVEDSIDGVIESIDDLPLNNGNKNALTVKLGNALACYDNGRFQAAVNKLNAFINQVELFRTEGKISNAEADALVAAAQALVDSITTEAMALSPSIEEREGGPKEPKIEPGSGLHAPLRFALYQNAPNPFNGATSVRYDVGSSGGQVTLRVFDVAGRLVRKLVDRIETSGTNSVSWDGLDKHGNQVPSGVYFYRLEALGVQQTLKMMLLR